MSHQPAEIIGGRIRERRLGQGMSQEELAAHAHTTARTVSRIELGRVIPHAATIELIAQGLDCAARDFTTPEEG